MVANPKILRRYTDLPAALYMLDRKAITLLDPTSWDDTNDSHYLRRYKERRGLTSLLAICFTQAGESYHHWRAFTHGSAGICVQFDRANLLQAVSGLRGILKRDVKYLTLPQARAARPSIMDLPFVKRHGFEHEQEYRIIYASKTDAGPTRDIPIDLSCIVRITLTLGCGQVSPHK